MGWNPSLSYTAEACDGHSGIALSLPKQVGLLKRGKQPYKIFAEISIFLKTDDTKVEVIIYRK